MALKRLMKQRWRLMLNIFTILALVIFVYAIRGQIADTFANIQRIHWWALALIVLLQFWNYDAQTRLYRQLFRIVGNNFSYKQMFIPALELNFINNVFPSGGVSGISYFGARMRSSHVTAGKATLVHVMKLLLLYVSFEILLVFGLFLLAAGNKVNNLALLSSAVITTSLVIGTFLFVYILKSKTRVEQFYRFLRRTYNALLRRLQGNKAQYRELVRVHFWLIELHLNFKTISSRYTELKKPLLQALFANVSEMLCIYIIYIAFGEWVNFGAIIVAYAVANFAGLISVLPGGIGIYEALKTSVLVAAGIPVSLSLPVTIMYRVLTSAIQLPPGYFFYHRAIHKGKLASQTM